MKSINRCIFLFTLVINQIAFANVLGNMQTFAPNPDSLVFQNIHASRTLDKSYFNVGFFAAYVRNELSAYDDLITPAFVNYKDKAVTFDFVAAWGVTRNLELTYVLPGYFSQEPDSGQSANHFISKGINGHRAGFKYNISQEKEGGFATSGSIDFTAAKDNPYIGNTPAPILNLELIYDHRKQDSGYGINLGYRKRTPGDAVTNSYFLPIGDQIIFSAGYVKGLSKRMRFHAELFSANAIQKGDHPDQKYINSLEILLGAKYKLAKNLWWHFGATAEAQPEGLAPDYRIYTGLNYYFGSPLAEAPTENEVARAALAVEPQYIDLGKEERQKVSVSGGESPYEYEVAQGLGYFDEENMEYVAPDSVGEDELIVKDSAGTKAMVKINVREKEPQADRLEVSPSVSNVYAGGATQFQVSGGRPPVSALVEPASCGTISNKSYKFRAAMQTAVCNISFQDQVGQIATVKVNVIDVPKASKTMVLRNLNFIFDTDRLTESSSVELEKNLKNMSKVKIKKIIVIGHADSQGDAEYNQDLSQKRAEAIAVLIRLRFGLVDDQVEALGYGESKPLVSNATEEGRLANRRVELKLYFNR